MVHRNPPKTGLDGCRYLKIHPKHETGRVHETQAQLHDCRYLDIHPKYEAEHVSGIMSHEMPNGEIKRRRTTLR